MVLILDGKTDLNQISLTGTRAITLLGLLAVAPRSMEEIRKAFLDYKIMEPSHSDDIIRVDINTLKSFGCVISRATSKTEYKYVMTKHPFGISITHEDVMVLKRFFDKIKNTLEISELLEADKLLNKISEFICDEDIKEEFMGISPLRHYNPELIREVFFSCNQGYTVKLNYKKTYTQKPIEKYVIAQKLIFRNDKLYLYGFDLEKQESCTLLFKRIKSVISKQLTNNNVTQNPVKVKFFLKNWDFDILVDGENVVEKTDNGFIAEGKYYNEFLATQRILSLGSKCIVQEPAEFRNKIITKLKNMRRFYDQ